MRKEKFLTLLAVPFLVTSIVGCSNTSSQIPTTSEEKISSISIDPEKSWSVSSVDGSLKVNCYLVDGQVYFDVAKNGEAVVLPSKLGLLTDSAFFEEGVTFDSKEERRIDVSYDNISGKSSHVETSCNELTVTFLEFDFYLDVTFRAYDDGYAIRYGIRAVDGGKGKFTITDEITSFQMPLTATTYSMPYKGSSQYFSYEEYYEKRSAKNIDGLKISMPFLYQASDNVWSLITEADIYGHEYIGSFLEGKKNGLVETMPAWKAAEENEVSFPFTSPWRLGITGSLSDIVESELVEAVYDEIEPWKPDNYNSLTPEEQEIYNYDWVQPDVLTWSWLSYTGHRNQKDWALHKEYIDLASEMGWTWYLLDGGWEPSLADMADYYDLRDYAREKNVKLMAWGHSIQAFSTPSACDAKLKNWADMGIEGIKIDFFDGQGLAEPWEFRGEDQRTIGIYENIYQTAAKYKMVVNCHGGNKPTGERRQYPHVINREAIRGNEMRSMISNQLVTIPFLRGVVGPSDYTPTLMPVNKTTTIGMQLALHVLYESGLTAISGKVAEYKNAVCKEFLRDLPVAWDETKLLSGKPMEDCVIARRKGNEWWIAGSTALEKEFEIDLSFLGEGTYLADIYRDGNSYVDLINDKEDVTASTKLIINASNNGGFAIRISAK